MRWSRWCPAELAGDAVAAVGGRLMDAGLAAVGD